MKIFANTLAMRKLPTGEFATQFLYFALPIGVATAVIIYLFYHHDVQMVEQGLRETEAHHLLLRDAIIHQNVAKTIQDLRLAADFAGSEPALLGTPGQRTRALERKFAGFCANHTQYRKIVSLAASGRRTAGRNCHRNGGASEFSGPVLRAGAGGTLLRQLATLRADGVFISPIQTVTEQTPAGPAYLPVVRFATPLAGMGSGERQFVIIDVELRYLISELMLDTGQGGTMILVEENGSFVRHPEAGERWGDTLAPGRALGFGAIYPKVWARLQQFDGGVVETGDGMFTYETLDLAKVVPIPGADSQAPVIRPNNAPRWKIVSYVPHRQITAGRRAFARKSIFLIPAPLLVILYLAHISIRRRRAVKDLEKNEQYLRQIMDSVVDGIVTTNQAGKIERANAATVALLGLPSPAQLPEHVSQLIPLHRLNPKGELARLWRGEETGRRLARDKIELQRQDGSRFPADLVLLDAELGGERRFIWIVRDVSEREAFEAKRNADRMRFFQQTKMAEIGLLAAGIIHEVGNPIAAISGMASEMEEEAEAGQSTFSEKARENLKMIAGQAVRMADITREISDFVRIRPGVTELFDLNSLIRGTTRLVSYDTRWKQTFLKLELDPEIPAIMGIQDQIGQVLMNLLVNAGDAVQGAPPGEAKVTVRTERRGANVVLTVMDNGSGLSEEVKRQAFESFFTTKPEGKGTGLGLSLCQTIVSAHQGTIEIDSSEGSGAVFRVSLPAPEATAAENLAG